MVAEEDKMDVQEEQDAKTVQAEMRAIVKNDARRRSRGRRSAFLSGGKASSPAWDLVSLRKRWLAGTNLG